MRITNTIRRSASLLFASQNQKFSVQVVHVTNLGNKIAAQATSRELPQYDADTWLKSHIVVNQTGMFAAWSRLMEFGFETFEKYEVAGHKENQSGMRQTMNRDRSGVPWM